MLSVLSFLIAFLVAGFVVAAIVVGILIIYADVLAHLFPDQEEDR